MFGAAFTDMLSGYRVFSRRFVKSFPVLSGGFEIETELTVHALELGLPVGRDRHALLRAAGRLGLQAQHLARRLPHPAHHLQALSRRAAAAVLRRHRHRARRSSSIGFAIPIFVTYLETGPGAAAADRGAVDRPDAAGVPVSSPSG